MFGVGKTHCGALIDLELTHLSAQFRGDLHVCRTGPDQLIRLSGNETE
jgi:hypothetical protein